MRTGRLISLVLVLALVVSLGGIAMGSWTKGELRIERWEDINTLDPAYLTSLEREFTIMNCLYNGLVKYEEGTWEVVPDLARGWDISEDNKEITFYLRKGVQFHKGYGELTAEDVKYSFERISDPEMHSTESVAWTALDHVEVIDKYTVKLVLKTPSARLFTTTLPLNSGFIVSKKAVEEMGREKFGTNPIGTGPYEFDHWMPKKETVLTAFKDYWGTLPKIEELIFLPIVSTPTAEMAFRKGETDISRVSLMSLKKLKEDPNFNVYVFSPLKYWWIGLTMTRKPFDNIYARKAIRYAVDVDEILDAAFYGYAERAYTWIPKGTLGYWEDAPHYEQNFDKAREFLKEAGYPEGFKITFYIWSGEDARIIAEVYKAQLAKVGIEVEIVEGEIGAFNEGTNKGETDSYAQFFGAGVDPAFNSEWWQSSSTWNPSQWRNPEWDELFEKAEREMDPQKRVEMYIEMQKMIDEAAWAIWLTYGVRLSVTQTYVDLGTPFPDGHLTPWTMDIKR
ncbi:hypothetical protein KAX17_14830 [Candidatus Bipolaricaulota bacterium]|nr:hypothetical protein [Candidatus Bipolaricaulota bacterium]